MDDLSVHQIMGEALISRGLATAEDVQADRAMVMAQMGLEPAQPANPAKAAAPGPTAPAQTPEAQAEADALDTLAFQGAASPQEYRFGAPPAGVQASLEQERSFRELFHSHEVPAAIGSEIARLWNKAAANPPNEAQLEQGRQDCSAQLHRMWGADTKNNLAVAQAEVQKIAKSNPQIIQMLEDSGLGNSPWLVSTLFNLAKARGRG